MRDNGYLQFEWFNAGATYAAVSSTAAAQASTDGTYLVAVVFDADNGASGNTLKFYHKPGGSGWTQLGTTVITAGASSLFTPVIRFDAGGVGAPGTGNACPINTELYSVAFGIADGTQAFPSAIRSWESPNKWEDYAVGAATYAHISGAPVLRFWNGAESGANLATNTTPKVTIKTPTNADLTIINCAHNSSGSGAGVWITDLAACIAAVKLRAPGTEFTVCTQNPKLPSDPYSRHQTARRNATIAYAAQGGYTALDTYRDFVDRADWYLSLAEGGLMEVGSVDDPHPNYVGYEFWAEKMADRLGIVTA